MDPLISVIVVTYNRAHYIQEALDSIRRQTFKDYEIIVVDDGSTDNTKEVLESYKDIRYIYQEHAGISQARNTAVRAAKGKWIATLDSDDLWKEEKLQKQIDYLAIHPECRIVYTTFSSFSDIPETQLDERQKDMLDTVVKWDLPTALIDTNLFNEVGLFDERLVVNEDTEWNLRLKFLKIDRNHCIEEALYLRRVHNSNITNTQKIFSVIDLQNLAINAYRNVKKLR